MAGFFKVNLTMAVKSSLLSQNALGERYFHALIFKNKKNSADCFYLLTLNVTALFCKHVWPFLTFVFQVNVSLWAFFNERTVCAVQYPSLPSVSVWTHAVCCGHSWRRTRWDNSFGALRGRSSRTVFLQLHLTAIVPLLLYSLNAVNGDTVIVSGKCLLVSLIPLLIFPLRCNYFCFFSPQNCCFLLFLWLSPLFPNCRSSIFLTFFSSTFFLLLLSPP